MTGPDQLAAMAADPATPHQVLADIAAQRPDLRAVIAANPAAYPGLLDWLGRLGDPAVDAAIAARGAAGAPGPSAAAEGWPTAVPPVPVAPYGQPVSPYGQPTAPYGQPVGPWAQPTFVATPQGGKKWPWVLAVVLVVLVGLGIGLFFLIKSFVSGLGDYGDDAVLDALWDACEAGDMAACDDLFRESPLGSEYERFADTCGDRQDGGWWCVGSVSESTGGPHAYGDDPALDHMWDRCSAGELEFCDVLFNAAPAESEYEHFADTCGERQPAWTGEWCAVATEANYGDDAALDALWDACADGSAAACDELYQESPFGSDYRAFADTCGDRQADGTGLWCQHDYGDDAVLDALWDDCEGGDLAACDVLFRMAPGGSEYQRFADTCGDRQGEETGAWCAP